MLRKMLILFFIVLTITTHLLPQAEKDSSSIKWVPFKKQERSKPTVKVSESNNNTVSFSVQINGMGTYIKKINEVPYHQFSIPDCETIAAEGSPQVPVITKLVAIPDCDDVSITVSPSSVFHFSNFNVLPAPKYEKKKSPYNDDILSEVYEEDKSIYLSGADFPGKFGEITEIGYVRGQKTARITLYPVQFNPAGKSINVYTDFNINLSFTNPKSPVNKELGIFRNMMHHGAINYELSGISASAKGSEVNKILRKSSLEKVASGSVTRVTNLSTLVGANAIPVDYLIITHSTLFNSTYLTTLANHRRDYNGYDVAIVFVDENGTNDIYHYEDTPGHIKYPSSSTTRYISIRDFLRDVYINGTANHTGDGQLGYVCLVGDARDDSDVEMLPASYAYGSATTLVAASDYYYTCLTQSGGTYDDGQDIMYGRLPVGNETELSNVVNKIISYENNNAGNWNNKAMFVSSAPEFFSIADPEISDMTAIIPPTYSKSYAYRAYDNSAATSVNPAEVSIFGQRFTSAQYGNDANLCGSHILNYWLYTELNNNSNRVHTFIFEDHGGWCALNPNEGWGRYIMYLSGLPNHPGIGDTGTVNVKLNNSLPAFMIFNCCDAGHFDNGHTSFPDVTQDCLSEQILNFANRGAIGIISSTRDSNTGSFGLVDNYVVDAEYNHLSHIMGEAFMEMKLRISASGFGLQYRRQYNLYGDPATNLWPTGYTVPENLSITEDTEISTNLTVDPGVTLTISQGVTIRFTNNAALIVNGTLNANGGSSSTPITFDFIEPYVNDNGTIFNGIRFNSGSTGIVNYCQIRNAYRGIYENNVSVNIITTAISGCTDGIYLNNSSPVIQGCNIHNNPSSGTGAGINLLYSSPSLYKNYIQNNFNGIYCSTNSNPVIGNRSMQTGNYISSNSYGVVIVNNAIPLIGNSSNGGFNNLLGNNTYNLLNTTGNTIYAQNNWWGSTNPANFLISGGSVSYTPYCTTQVSIDAPQLSKANGNIASSLNEDIPMLSELDKAYQLVDSRNFTEARKVCLNLVNNYPDYSVSFNALNLLKETYPVNELSAKKNIFETLSSNKSKKDLYAIAGVILSDIDKDNKLKHLNDVLENYKEGQAAELAMFNKFVYYYFEMEDVKNALAVSKQLDERFPKSNASIEAHKILGDEEYFGLNADNKQVLQKEVAEVPKEFMLFDNYPNPFNPATVIKYAIPQNSKVVLEVYNTLGEKVAALVNEAKSAGFYETSFDGCNLSSGIYIYRLTANSLESGEMFVKSGKMMLIK